MMINLVGVKFKREGKIYNFDAADNVLHKNDKVIVNTENGLALGFVATEVRRREVTQPPADLGKIIRPAAPND
ncbi:MAG TPA: stage 0 sporulation protein, partial [Smithella sp.]|nr:stage 0 sporulation protein [Smithella sp.]